MALSSTQFTVDVPGLSQRSSGAGGSGRASSLGDCFALGPDFPSQNSFGVGGDSDHGCGFGGWLYLPFGRVHMVLSG